MCRLVSLSLSRGRYFERDDLSNSDLERPNWSHCAHVIQTMLHLTLYLGIAFVPGGQVH